MIHFFTEDVSFTLQTENSLREWITNILRNENVEEGELNYIFCSDHFLHELNIQYLNHDTLTDIITFNQSDSSTTLEADIYISIDRVLENAQERSISFTDELHRVMIHGILHLIGYSDKTPKEKQLMREKEDECLSLRNNIE